MMNDIRTPSEYFESRNKKRKKLEELKLRLNDILIHLQKLKGQTNTTQGYKRVVEHEMKRIEKKKRNQLHSEGSKIVLDKILDNDNDHNVVESIKEELDERIFRRIENHFNKATSQMKDDVFNHK